MQTDQKNGIGRSLVRVFVSACVVMTLSGCTTTRHNVPPAAKPDAACPKEVSHTVRSGETLYSISRLYNVDANVLARRNNLDNTGTVTAGQILLIAGIADREKPESESGRRHSTVAVFAWPVKGTVISSFGDRIDTTHNKGIDIRAAAGTPVRAALNGTVVYCDPSLKGFGKTVIIDHGDNYQTVYAFNTTILVKVGDTVVQNDQIARVGATGRAREPSLHFEIRKDGEPINPLCYLR